MARVPPRRFDLSDTLIHFVRPIDLSSDDYFPDEFLPVYPDWGLDENVDNRLSPFFVLRRIVRRLQILATWSRRPPQGSATIYGPYPAVCFTEMPLAAFVAYSADRTSRHERISSYGISIPKCQMFRCGARPVIYGSSLEVRPVDRSDGYRGLEPAVFADEELFRYVAYDPTRAEPCPLDWSHEREWRWPNKKYRYVPLHNEDFWDDPEVRELSELQIRTRIDFHGLNLESNNFSGLGLIVKSANQKDKLLRDILWLIDSHVIDKDLFSHILVTPDLTARLPDLHRPEAVQELIASNLIHVSSYFEVTATQLSDVNEKLNRIAAELASIKLPDNGPCGPSYPRLLSNRTPLARALAILKRIVTTERGAYLANLPGCNRFQGMDANEILAKRAVELLRHEFNEDLTYYSVAGDWANDVPYYSGDHPSDETNHADDPEDY